MIVLILWMLAGVLLGVITGMIPGLHVNNLTPAFVILAGGSGSVEIASLIVAMSITNVFVSYIPSTYLGVPEEGTELSVLPAHRLLLDGRGHYAIKLVIFGCLGGLLVSAAFLFPFLMIVEPAYGLIKPNMHWLLLFVVIVMIAIERSPSKIVWSCVIFVLSGFLGLVALDGGILKSETALMPLLSGLFGASVLLPSIASNCQLPEQKIDDREPDGLKKPILTGAFAGAVTGIIPGIGPSQGTVLAQLVSGCKGTEDFLAAVSSVNTSKALFSFAALYAIGRGRSGAAVAVGQILEIGSRELIIMVGVSLFAGGIAGLLTLKLSKIMAREMSKLPYRGLCAAVLVFITFLVFFYSGFVGLLVFATATSIGVLPAVVQVKRTHAMGVILLPCILFFAGVKESTLSMLRLA
ncbi:MAG: tripartite tricarboxylate transporter permease [Candidatus Hadarchaeales archaeon]